MNNFLTVNSIAGFSIFLQKRGRTKATIESYTRDARMFIEYLDSQQINEREIDSTTFASFADFLQQKQRKANSIRRKIIGTKQFIRYVSLLQADYDGCADEVPLPKRVDPELPVFSTKFFSQLVEKSLDASPQIKALRDSAILHLLALEGLKVCELTTLKWHQLAHHNDFSSINIPGSRSRSIVIEPTTGEAIKKYQNEFHRFLKGHSPEYLFIAFKGKESVIVLPRLGRHGVKHLLYELSSRAKGQTVNTEVLRHHAMDFQLKLGKSPEQVMNHLGLRQLGKIARHLNQICEDHGKLL